MYGISGPYSTQLSKRENTFFFFGSSKLSDTTEKQIRKPGPFLIGQEQSYLETLVPSACPEPEVPSLMVIMKYRQVTCHFLSKSQHPKCGRQSPLRLGPFSSPDSQGTSLPHPTLPQPLGSSFCLKPHMCFPAWSSLPSPDGILLRFLLLVTSPRKPPLCTACSILLIIIFTFIILFIKYLLTIHCWEGTASGSSSPHFQHHFPESISFPSPFIKQVCQVLGTKDTTSDK